MRNTFILVLNDLAAAFKNKTIYLIIFIPVFVFLSLKLVDNQTEDVQKIKIGIIKNAYYPAGLIKNIKSADEIFEICLLSAEPEGKRLLKEKKIDGFLIKDKKQPKSAALFVLKRQSFQTIAIIEGLFRIAEIQAPAAKRPKLDFKY